MFVRYFLTLTLALAPTAAATAAPRDEALRLAPKDFALVVVVQNFRDHAEAVMESPFAAWFPTSAIGKRFLASTEFKLFTDSSTPIFATLGITPPDLFHDILGDAVVFAYTPAPPGETKGERSIILIRPRKLESLVKLIDRLNEAQTESKEVKTLVAHKYAGETYHERQKPEGPSDFYCFRAGVFAISQSEADIKAVIDRDKNAAKGKPPELVARMTKLGVADAAAVVLLNPRSFDADIAAKKATEQHSFLNKFAEVWTATESAALYFALDRSVEVGVSLQFNADKLPAEAKAWLASERMPSALWSVIPDRSLLAVAGRVKANDLIDFLGSLNTVKGKPTARETIEQALGPIVGKDKLPLVLDAIGPDWGVWILPQAATDTKTSAIPVLVSAVKVQNDGEKGAEASQALLQTLEYGFQTARVAYNVRHKEQIELREEKDGDVIIKSLAGDALPAGFRPCFALKGSYLVVATSPDAIKSFTAPMKAPKPGGDVLLARFNATATRAYLTSHSSALAKLLSNAGAGEEKMLTERIDNFAAILELVEKIELLTSGDANGMKLMLRMKTAKPLKK